MVKHHVILCALGLISVLVFSLQKLVVYDWIPSWLNASLGGYDDDGENMAHEKAIANEYVYTNLRSFVIGKRWRAVSMMFVI